MSIFSTSNANLTPKLHSIIINQSLDGIPVPLACGRVRLAGNLLWSGDFQSVAQQSPGGKGFGGKDATSWDYLTAVQLALCAGPIGGVPNIWASNGRLTQSGATETYTVPSGGGSYTVTNSSKFSVDNGVARADAYSFAANDYGSPGYITFAGTQQTPMKLVPSSPGAGEYTQSGGTYTFSAADAGKTVTITYTYSLYVLGEQEDYLVPSTTPYLITVQYQPYFQSDGGVIFVDTGKALTLTGGTPTEGQYAVNDGNYTFAAADAGRPVAISYTWNNSQFTTDPTSTLQLTIIEGTQGQSAWSYMQSKHASMALGYSGIAQACSPALDMGPSATLPQYNYEVLAQFAVGGGIDDANPADWINYLLTDSVWGVNKFQSAWIGSSQLTQTRTYWQAAGFFISQGLSTQKSAADIIQEILDAGNAAAFASEGLLKTLPYGDSTLVGNGAIYTPQTHPVVDLDDDDFISEGNNDPVQIVRTPWQDAYNVVRVQYSNRLNSYTSEIVEEYDQNSISKFGERVEDQKDYNFVCTLEAATFAANIRLRRLVNIRDQYKFTISGVRYWYLEPMDLVTITDSWLGLSKTPVRILEIEEDSQGNYAITAEQFPWGTATATLYPKATNSGSFPTQAQAGPGNVNTPVFFEALDRLTGQTGYELWIGISGNNPNWGGCHVWVSEDGTNYVDLAANPVTSQGRVIRLGMANFGIQQGQCRMGALTAVLPTGSDPDTANALSVSLQESFGELQSVTDAQADALSTLCWVDGELISFATATLTGPYQYNLTYLRRGCLGTTITSHASGAQFLRLDGQVYKWGFDASLIGKTLYFKFTSFNLLNQAMQNLADVEAYEYTIIGNFQGAISQNGSYIGGQGSSSVTFNSDFSYTTTTTTLTVSGTVMLSLTNLGLSNVTLNVSQSVTSLVPGDEYWLFPYAIQDAFGNWSVQWVANGDNGVTGGVGTPAIAFPGSTSPLGTNEALSQFYLTGAFTPLSNGGLNVTIPTSGTGGGSGGGNPPPVCLHEDMLVDEFTHGTITAKRLWEIAEGGERLFLRDGDAFHPVAAVYRAPCRRWCRIRFANGEEAVTTEGHWWMTEGGDLVKSEDLAGAMVECDGGFTRADEVLFEEFSANYIRLVIRSKRQMHNTGLKTTSLRTHNFFTTP